MRGCSICVVALLCVVGKLRPIRSTGVVEQDIKRKNNYSLTLSRCDLPCILHCEHLPLSNLEYREVKNNDSLWESARNQNIPSQLYRSAVPFQWMILA